MRLVLGTNIVIAALVANGLCCDIVRKRVSTHTLILSQQLLGELGEKLAGKFHGQPNHLAFLTAYRDAAEFVIAPPLTAPVCRDPDDDLILATALAGNAEIIVTGDADLLTPKSFQGIKIVSPRQFVTLLDTGR